MTQLALTLDPAHDRGIPGRRRGIKQAADHAGPTWADIAFQAFKAYAAAHHEFITAEVRQYALDAGVPQPPTNWAWGSVAVRAVRAGLVVAAGTRPYGDGNNHQKQCVVWRSVAFDKSHS
jgi:hypothetical protein